MLCVKKTTYVFFMIFYCVSSLAYAEQMSLEKMSSYLIYPLETHKLYIPQSYTKNTWLVTCDIYTSDMLESAPSISGHNNNMKHKINITTTGPYIEHMNVILNGKMINPTGSEPINMGSLNAGKNTFSINIYNNKSDYINGWLAFQNLDTRNFIIITNCILRT